MAFKLLSDTYHVETRRALLDNSLTVKKGDVIIPVPTNPSIVTNATTNVTGDKYVLGVVVGFSGPNGEVIGQGSGDTLVTAADNTTNAKYHAVYIPIKSEMIFLADLTATPGTTADSDKPFVWFNLANARQVDESSVVLTEAATAPLQVLSLGVFPIDTSKIMVKFAKALLERP
jgi:hypothetical protein